MLLIATSKVVPRSFRRIADNTPVSRVETGIQYPPTSPKIHELRERYESLQEKKNVSNST